MPKTSPDPVKLVHEKVTKSDFWDLMFLILHVSNFLSPFQLYANNTVNTVYLQNIYDHFTLKLVSVYNRLVEGIRLFKRFHSCLFTIDM